MCAAGALWCASARGGNTWLSHAPMAIAGALRRRCMPAPAWRAARRALTTWLSRHPRCAAASRRRATGHKLNTSPHRRHAAAAAPSSPFSPAAPRAAARLQQLGGQPSWRRRRAAMAPATAGSSEHRRRGRRRAGAGEPSCFRITPGGSGDAARLPSGAKASSRAAEHAALILNHEAHACFVTWAPPLRPLRSSSRPCGGGAAPAWAAPRAQRLARCGARSLAAGGTPSEHGLTGAAGGATRAQLLARRCGDVGGDATCGGRPLAPRAAGGAQYLGGRRRRARSARAACASGGGTARAPDALNSWSVAAAARTEALRRLAHAAHAVDRGRRRRALVRWRRRRRVRRRSFACNAPAPRRATRAARSQAARSLAGHVAGSARGRGGRPPRSRRRRARAALLAFHAFAADAASSDGRAAATRWHSRQCRWRVLPGGGCARPRALVSTATARRWVLSTSGGARGGGQRRRRHPARCQPAATSATTALARRGLHGGGRAHGSVRRDDLFAPAECAVGVMSARRAARRAFAALTAPPLSGTTRAALRPQGECSADGGRGARRGGRRATATGEVAAAAAPGRPRRGLRRWAVWASATLRAAARLARNCARGWACWLAAARATAAARPDERAAACAPPRARDGLLAAATRSRAPPAAASICARPPRSAAAPSSAGARRTLTARGTMWRQGTGGCARRWVRSRV